MEILNTAAELIKRPVCSIRTRWKLAHRVRKKKRTTIATFPDPDLLPVIIADEQIEAATRCSRQSCLLLRRARFMADFGVTEYDASRIDAVTRNGGLLRGCCALLLAVRSKVKFCKLGDG